MPLLRLLHQITNMYQNVKEAQNELREQQPGGNKRVATLKDESSLGKLKKLKRSWMHNVENQSLELYFSNGKISYLKKRKLKKIAKINQFSLTINPERKMFVLSF